MKKFLGVWFRKELLEHTPVCGDFFDVIRAMQKKAPQNVRWIFLHYTRVFGWRSCGYVEIENSDGISKDPTNHTKNYFYNKKLMKLLNSL